MLQEPDVPKGSTDVFLPGVDTDAPVADGNPEVSVEHGAAALDKVLESSETPPVSPEMKLALRLQKEGYITDEQVELLRGMKQFDKLAYLLGYATLVRNVSKAQAKTGKMTPSEKATILAAAILKFNNAGLLDQIVDMFDLSNIEGEGRPNVPKTVPHLAEELLRKELFGKSALEYFGISLDELDTPDSTEHKE